jgi:hypothetical protein
MWGPIILQLIPQIPAVIAAFIHEKYPALSDEQVHAITVEITGVSDPALKEAIAIFSGGVKPPV